MMKVFALCAPALLLAEGCASTSPSSSMMPAPPDEVSYAPRPADVTQPEIVLKSLIQKNTVQGWVSKAARYPGMLVVKTSSHLANGTQQIQFNDVDSIKVQRADGWYRVHVHHRERATDFVWTSTSLEDVQQMADAIAALKEQRDTRVPSM